ncbi:MAG TPA: hypothetical protein VMU34_19125 [Mycobacterium sp.]|nr:hypothetical protein [Mycobacterium sp.]
MSITGRYVISALNAPQLVIEPDPGASTISVVITGNADGTATV